MHFHRGRQINSLKLRLGPRELLHVLVASFQYRYYLRIETLAGLRDQNLHGLIQRQRSTVLPIGGECVQAIDGGQNTRPQRDLLTFETKRIAGAIPFLVVGSHQWHYRIGEVNALQDLRANYRVNLHLLELFRRQLTRLGDDVVGYRQLTDVVQNRGSLKSQLVLFGETQLLCHFPCVYLHPLQMFASGLVLRFNGQRQGLNRAHVQSGQALRVILLGS